LIQLQPIIPRIFGRNTANDAAKTLDKLDWVWIFDFVSYGFNFLAVDEATCGINHMLESNTILIRITVAVWMIFGRDDTLAAPLNEH
jgi:hypothetical protein